MQGLCGQISNQTSLSYWYIWGDTTEGRQKVGGTGRKGKLLDITTKEGQFLGLGTPIRAVAGDGRETSPTGHCPPTKRCTSTSVNIGSNWRPCSWPSVQQWRWCLHTLTQKWDTPKTGIWDPHVSVNTVTDWQPVVAKGKQTSLIWQTRWPFYQWGCDEFILTEICLLRESSQVPLQG